MKKDPDTLFDMAYRDTFAKKKLRFWTRPVVTREKLIAARRFVLNDDMSRFLGDLTTVAFQGKHPLIQGVLADQMRMSARLPHRITWIEFNLRRELDRCNELRGYVKGDLYWIDPEQAPHWEGWLLEQHPDIETAFRVHLFHNTDGYLGLGNFTFVFPSCIAWTTDDALPPWRFFLDPEVRGHSPSQVLTGVSHYHSDKVALVHSDLVDPFAVEADKLSKLIMDWTGVIRRVWAFLATINDVPVIKKEVRAARGFVARGSYHKFLDRTTITLNIPYKTDPIKVARNLIACVHRRAHQVRGHWRLDYHHRGDQTHGHVWNADQWCECGARRVWIKEHERGDASLGHVTHDYRVTHEEKTEGRRDEPRP